MFTTRAKLTAVPLGLLLMGLLAAGTASAETCFLVSEVKLRKYLSPWYDHPVEDAFVPLSLNSDAPTRPVYAFLREERGDIVKATFDLNPVRPSPKTGLRQLPIQSFSEFGRPGTYSGVVAGVKDENGNSVTITVTAAHHPLFALIAMAAALGLALLIQRYTGVLRSSWKLWQRAYELGATFTTVNQDPRAVFGYSIQTDVTKRLNGITGGIEHLERSSFTSLDETSQAYSTVQGEIESLDSTIKTWSDFAANLKLLAEALGSTGWGPIPPFGGMPARPEIYQEKVRLLAGRALSGKELEEIAPLVSEAPATLELWKNLNAQADTLARRIEDLLERLGSGEDPRLQEVRERIQAARASLSPLWNHLWIEPVPDLAAASGRLKEIEGSLWIERDLLSDASVNTVQAEPEKKDSPPKLPSYKQLAGQLRARSQAAELAISLLAFLIALYTGMVAQYFDKPFGTWRDYVDIVVWAVTAQAVSDLLLRALDRLWALGGAVRIRPSR
jgi:hypothetical protein